MFFLNSAGGPTVSGPLFQLSTSLVRSASGVKDMILTWCQCRTRDYQVESMKKPFRLSCYSQWVFNVDIFTCSCLWIPQTSWKHFFFALILPSVLFLFRFIFIAVICFYNCFFGVQRTSLLLNQHARFFYKVINSIPIYL